MILFSSNVSTNTISNEGWVANDTDMIAVTSPIYTPGYSLEANMTVPNSPISSRVVFTPSARVYIHFYFYIQTLPNDGTGTCYIARIISSDGVPVLNLRFRSSDNKLEFLTQLGSLSGTSSALTTGQFYKIGIYVNSTNLASVLYEGKLNDTVFSNGSYDTAGEISTSTNNRLQLGLDIAGGDTSAGRINFDAIIISDNQYPSPIYDPIRTYRKQGFQ